MASSSLIQARQIRALQDGDHITVYQAYNATIASAAVESQRLTASPTFKLTRMTWVKPSWCWMMYRSGYSYKDDNQARILALRMKKTNLIELLERSILAKNVDKETGEQIVRIQWDPERGPRLEQLGYRSIQIGIPRGLCDKWANNWVEEITDVTDKAKELKKVLDGRPDVSNEELVELGLLPDEQPFEVPGHVAAKLEMNFA